MNHRRARESGRPRQTRAGSGKAAVRSGRRSARPQPSAKSGSRKWGLGAWGRAPLRLLPQWEHSSPAQIRATFGSADFLAGNRVVFDIKGNAHRLVAQVKYAPLFLVFVRFLGTHAEYGRINRELGIPAEVLIAEHRATRRISPRLGAQSRMKHVRGPFRRTAAAPSSDSIQRRRRVSAPRCCPSHCASSVQTRATPAAPCPEQCPYWLTRPKRNPAKQNLDNGKM